jgi:hypothetical protein
MLDTFRLKSRSNARISGCPDLGQSTAMMYRYCGVDAHLCCPPAPHRRAARRKDNRLPV